MRNASGIRYSLLSSLIAATGYLMTASPMASASEELSLKGPVELPPGVQASDVEKIASIIQKRFDSISCERVNFELFDLQRPKVDGYPTSGLPYIVNASNRHAVESYNALADLGLFTRSEMSVNSDGSQGKDALSSKVYIYAQTPLGKESEALEAPGYTCVCKTELVSIDSITHKPPAFGQDLYEVTYTIRRTAIAPWALDNRGQSSWTDVARLINGSMHRRESFLRSASGWTPGSPTLFAPHR